MMDRFKIGMVKSWFMTQSGAYTLLIAVAKNIIAL